MKATQLNTTRTKLISLSTLLPVFVTLTISLSVKANEDENHAPQITEEEYKNIRCILPESFESEPEVEGSFLASNNKLSANMKIAFLLQDSNEKQYRTLSLVGPSKSELSNMLAIEIPVKATRVVGAKSIELPLLPLLVIADTIDIKASLKDDVEVLNDTTDSFMRVNSREVSEDDGLVASIYAGLFVYGRKTLTNLLYSIVSVPEGIIKSSDLKDDLKVKFAVQFEGIRKCTDADLVKP